MQPVCIANLYPHITACSPNGETAWASNHTRYICLADARLVLRTCDCCARKWNIWNENVDLLNARGATIGSVPQIDRINQLKLAQIDLPPIASGIGTWMLYWLLPEIAATGVAIVSTACNPAKSCRGLCRGTSSCKVHVHFGQCTMRKAAQKQSKHQYFDWPKKHRDRLFPIL